MVMQSAEGHLEWTMAAPLWRFIGDQPDSATRLSFLTPTILRFASDSFMEDFANLLTTEPERLYEYVAAPETWSSPPGEPSAPLQKSGMALKLYRARNAAIRRLESRGARVIGKQLSSAPTKVLKLYQPAHQRFYLVATCLVCRTLGLPDRRIDAGAQEKAAFVLRLLQPRAGADSVKPDPRMCDEFALVKGAWQKLDEPDTLAEGEEQRPLSPAAYTEDDNRRRRLLVGLIPVGDRERLLQAVQPKPGPQDATKPLDSRQMLLKSRVIGPIKNLEDLASSTFSATKPPDSTDPTQAPLTTEQDDARKASIPKILQSGNDQLQQVSWYILLDFARYLETQIPDLWQEIDRQSSDPNLGPNLKALWNAFAAKSYSGTTLLSALKKAYDAADALEGMTTTYNTQTTGGTAGWPDFQFSFYTVTWSGVQGLTPDLQRSELEDLVVKALPDKDPHPPLPPRSVAQASVNPQAPAWFTIRCILERPNCGRLTPPLVSEPTVAFQMAAFFDPDAPSRPIRIGLPLDTTPAGLRKFDRNTAFIMSDTLCGQVRKMSGMSFADLIMSVLPFPLHKGLDGGGGTPCKDNGDSAGMVCSFSIPIITICALILLIIFVKLLDIIFYWMPFFQVCLPLPGFTAKESK